MAQLFPVAILENSTYSWLPKVTVKGQFMYSLLLLSASAGLVSLFYIHVDVTTTAQGLVRPAAEKNDLRSPVAGTIAQVLVSDGATVQQGQLLLRLKQEVPDSKLAETAYDLGAHEAYIHDLTILTNGGDEGLTSSLYRQQYARFQSALGEQRATVSKLRSDLAMDRTLLAGKVIAPKEFQDKQYEFQKAMAAYQSAIDQQRSDWQDQLSRLRMESSGLHADVSQLRQQQEWSQIKAPVGGTLQQFEGKSAGGYVQAGELLGTISPDSNLVAECYVSPKDIGYLKPGMVVRFQVDAFNYTDWGVLKGTIESVGNDFILQDGRPVFKVRCSFSGTCLQMPGGVKGDLKKGMTLQARFLLTRRTLYQLLYDRTSDWLKPGNKT
jgi:membrane fusion protein, peptide pheromone/bacteriocin exporter